MESPQEYLERTKSAVEHILSGVDAYMQILRNSRPPVFSGSFRDEQERDKALEKWLKEKEQDIRRGLAAEREFLSEKYALAALCGSLLQIASMAIRLYSKNESVPAELSEAVTKPAIIYCIGRLVREVPIGLIIYAGRNQYNHIDDEKLREPSATVFEWLTTRHGYGDGVRDPAFDLNEGLRWNYASNVTSLIGWRNYQAYEVDMKLLLGI